MGCSHMAVFMAGQKSSGRHRSQARTTHVWQHVETALRHRHVSQSQVKQPRDGTSQLNLCMLLPEGCHRYRQLFWPECSRPEEQWASGRPSGVALHAALGLSAASTSTAEIKFIPSYWGTFTSSTPPFKTRKDLGNLGHHGYLPLVSVGVDSDRDLLRLVKMCRMVSGDHLNLHLEQKAISWVPLTEKKEKKRQEPVSWNVNAVIHKLFYKGHRTHDIVLRRFHEIHPLSPHAC